MGGPTKVITFQSWHVPKLFIKLCLCVAVIGAIGYTGAMNRPGLPFDAVPVAADLGEDPDDVVLAEQGKVVPDFTLADIDGRAVSLSAYRGRPVIVYFWASWCPYCIDEMPGFNGLRDKYQDAGLEILAVNILEQAAHVRASAREMNLSYPVLLDQDARVTRSFVIRATPTFILIDRNGVYHDVVIGSPREGVLEGKIEALIRIRREETGS